VIEDTDQAASTASKPELLLGVEQQARPGRLSCCADLLHHSHAAVEAEGHGIAQRQSQFVPIQGRPVEVVQALRPAICLGHQLLQTP
jgi:hypothetical protein